LSDLQDFTTDSGAWNRECCEFAHIENAVFERNFRHADFIDALILNSRDAP